MAVLSDDMGGITAYAAAVNRGYTGTKEEFEQLMYSYTEVAERAEAAAGNAHESEEASIEAKDIAVGAKNEAVSARDAAVSARDASVSAKNDSESARDAAISAKDDTLVAKDAVMSAKGSVDEISANFSDAVTAAISDVNAAGRNQKELAKTHAIDSEAWAVGQREGADVGVSDETYHNNSKYYAEQSALAKSETETARDDAVSAKTAAQTAQAGAETAAASVQSSAAQIATNTSDISELKEDFATMESDGVAPSAEQILTDKGITDSVPYHYRKTGGDGADRLYDQIVGGTVCWNQLVQTSSTSVTVTSGHKYYSNINGTKTIGASIGTAIGINDGTKDNVVDLTQALGSTIGDYIYSLEQATAGAGVAFFKSLFPNDYYPYDSGTLKSVEGLSEHKMVGFNQFNKDDPTIVNGKVIDDNGVPVDASKYFYSGYIPVLPNTEYYIGNFLINSIMHCGGYYDENKNYISSIRINADSRIKTTPNNCRYIIVCAHLADKEKVCINLSDPTKDGTYEPYKAHSYPLDDSLTLRGIPKLVDGKMCFDGDTYDSDGTVTRRYGVVDLGTLNWNYSGESSNHRFSAMMPSNYKTPTSAADRADLVCSEYASNPNVVSITDALGICGYQGSNVVYIRDLAYSDVPTFKAAMSGVMLVYELATPTTEEAQPFTNPQIVDDFGTEEYVTNSIVPVGHITKYANNLRAKLEMAPNSPDGDGDYIVRQTSGLNEYVSLSSSEVIQNINEAISDNAEQIETKADVTELLKAFPADTATGAVASFSDGANLSLKSLIVNIDPVQEGSGDPSPDNVRPISGWSEVNVQRTGKNLLDSEHATIYNRYIQYYETNNANWLESSDSASYCISVKPNTSYAIKAHGDTVVFRACAISVDPSSIGSNAIHSTNAYSANASTHKYCVITTGSNETWLVVQLGKTVVENGTGMVMVELGNTYSDYSPYQGNTYIIALGQTVYGGTLDVVSGVLTVDRAMVDLGTLTWTKAATQTDKWRFGVDISNIARNNNGNTVPDILCEVYAAISPNGSYTGATGISNNVTSNSLFICDLSISEVADLKAVINGKKVVYPIVTPLTVQLTPHEVTALLGSNNVWADSGDSAVEYRADLTLYINKKIAEAISALS